MESLKTPLLAGVAVLALSGCLMHTQSEAEHDEEAVVAALCYAAFVGDEYQTLMDNFEETENGDEDPPELYLGEVTGQCYTSQNSCFGFGNNLCRVVASGRSFTLPIPRGDSTASGAVGSSGIAAPAGAGTVAAAAAGAAGQGSGEGTGSGQASADAASANAATASGSGSTAGNELASAPSNPGSPTASANATGAGSAASTSSSAGAVGGSGGAVSSSGALGIGLPVDVSAATAAGAVGLGAAVALGVTLAILAQDGDTGGTAQSSSTVSTAGDGG
ncbi:MAG: hypothetical protein AAF713_01065 [Pseudomonadota bacterium]